jgi:drug/metabolite transporter (DMT)-like permease
MLAVALALAASICWGSGDFLGGLLTRRATLWAVVVGSQAAGLAGAVLVVTLVGRPWPGLDAVWPVVLGGMAGAVAIATFYKALAIGTMSIVAPVSALSVFIPFAAGKRPASLQLLGAALAAGGVLLAVTERARAGDTIGAAALPDAPAVEPHVAAGGGGTDGQTEAGGGATAGGARRLSVALALVAAGGIGLMLLGFDAAAEHDALWAMLGGRISSVVFFSSFLLLLRPRIGLQRSALPGIIAVGLLDTAANGFFALATTHGFLSLVAVIGSLYPVFTVLLAFGLLHERLAPHQLAGVCAALAGVALITVG